MPSPFPGMDPWLEDPEVFPNLHEKLVVYISEALNAVMPPGYVATIKNRVVVDEARFREPDVALFAPNAGFRSGAVAMLPGLLAIGQERESDPIEEPYLEIVSAGGKRLIAAVEVISITNKKSGKKNRVVYKEKQKEYRDAGVNIVEIDLLRRGPHVSAVPLFRIQQKAPAPFDYHVSVLAAGNRTRLYAAPIKLTDRLPAIGIPLDSRAAPVTIDLQPLLDRAYDTGRYPELVDYRKPCEPPLMPEQQAWAEGILRKKGLLKSS